MIPKNRPEVETKDVGVAAALFQAWYSQDPYRAAAILWRAKIWLFLVLVVLLVQYPNSVRTMREVEREVDRVVERVSVELPGLQVRNGELQLSDKQQRHEFSLSLFGMNPQFVVDATLDTPVFPVEPPTIILVTKRELAIRLPDGQSHRFALGLAGDFGVTKDLLQSYGAALVQILWLTLPVVLFFGGAVVVLFRVLLLALSGWMVFPHARARLSFGASFRVAAVAIAPAALLEALLAAIGIESFGWQIASLLLAVSYFLFGLRVLLPPAEPSDSD